MAKLVSVVVMCFQVTPPGGSPVPPLDGGSSQNGSVPSPLSRRVDQIARSESPLGGSAHVSNGRMPLGLSRVSSLSASREDGVYEQLESLRDLLEAHTSAASLHSAFKVWVDQHSSLAQFIDQYLLVRGLSREQCEINEDIFRQLQEVTWRLGNFVLPVKVGGGYAVVFCQALSEAIEVVARAREIECFALIHVLSKINTLLYSTVTTDPAVKGADECRQFTEELNKYFFSALCSNLDKIHCQRNTVLDFEIEPALASGVLFVKRGALKYPFRPFPCDWKHILPFLQKEHSLTSQSAWYQEDVVSKGISCNCMTFACNLQSLDGVSPNGTGLSSQTSEDLRRDLIKCGCIEIITSNTAPQTIWEGDIHLVAFVFGPGTPRDYHVYRCFLGPEGICVWMEYTKLEGVRYARLPREGHSNAYEVTTALKSAGIPEDCVTGIPNDPRVFCKAGWTEFVGYWIVPASARVLSKNAPVPPMRLRSLPAKKAPTKKSPTASFLQAQRALLLTKESNPHDVSPEPGTPEA